MLTALQRRLPTASDHVQRRGLVVVCGWLGAKAAHVEKYAALVAQSPLATRGVAAAQAAEELQLGGARVLSFVAPPATFFRPQQQVERLFCEMAERVLRRQRVHSIASGTAEPLVFYAFSENGALSLGLLLQALRTQLDGAGRARSKATPPPIVSGVIFDSAPCHLDERVLARGYMGIATAAFSPKPRYNAGVATTALEACFALLRRAWPSRRKLLDGCIDELMELGRSQPLALQPVVPSQALDAPPPRQLVLLSEGDEVILREDILSFLARQAERGAPRARVEEFGATSHHVQHFRQAPGRYRTLVQEFVREAHRHSGDVAAEHG